MLAHLGKKQHLIAYAPTFSGTQRPFLVHAYGCSCWKRWGKGRCTFSVQVLKRLVLRPFVHAHICLHLWNACALLWRPSRSLVPLFVRAPAFNRSGLCHINNSERREEIRACCSAVLYTAADPSVTQWRIRKRESMRDNKRQLSQRGVCRRRKQGSAILLGKGEGRKMEWYGKRSMTDNRKEKFPPTVTWSFFKHWQCV